MGLLKSAESKPQRPSQASGSDALIFEGSERVPLTFRKLFHISNNVKVELLTSSC